MKASDLSLLTSLSRPALHPDGTRAVVAVSHPDLAADRTVGQLWSVAVPGGARRRITRGVADGSPAFSPDGALLAFTRADSDGRGQVFVTETDGGEPIQVTDAPLGIDDYVWSPDSRSLAFTARVPEPGRYGSVADLGPNAEAPRRITTLKYTANGLGYITDRRSHVFLVEVPSPGEEPRYRTAPSVGDEHPDAPAAAPVARQLTTGDADDSAPRFSPDGLRIAFVSARRAPDATLANEIYVVAVAEESTPELLSAPEPLSPADAQFGIDDLGWAADGHLLFTGIELGPHGTDFIGRSGGLFHLDPSTSAVTRLTDTAYDVGGELTVVGDAALVGNVSRGRVTLLRVTHGSDLAGTQIEVVAGGDVEISGVSAVEGTIVVAYAAPETTGELGLVLDGSVVALTDFSAPLREAGIIPAPEFSVESRDGHPVHGWVLTPAGAGPHPVLLVIHGGPFAQYTVSLFDEAQVYADAGYAVVMCNPRGSAGYGEEHGRAVRHAMGTVDLTDVLDFLDGAISANPTFDAGRVGIMGGSYGGYLTAWTIAHDHRFAGAIVERGFLDPEGFVGTSDIGSFFGDEYVGTDAAAIAKQSPQAVVGQVRTPTFVIHSADDLRCPLPQGERYYAALKRRGVETELLIFPGENHELSRSGRPRHRLQRFEAILDWWARSLPVTAPTDNSGTR
ncbi:S9 family peptidase [Lacisediminihabitans changchengi]|uniref:S9 family peptidase n=1 Tax=Lacisediminihabitans changchengi TaxID=2787634 RepID=A0A934SMQ6_9MICO|nr:S9 family peptidase [Lacisediminihabitans changchengi]MBK4347045.1 S9 family peptidase [Lacisediminihabitans changchengi]MBK4347832.1 S9 family peptidase [Lacisediminihabitans changchengi]